METLQQLFEEYMKSYDCDGFDERAISEMRLCFFAGAAAAQAITKEIALRYGMNRDRKSVMAHVNALDQELIEFMRELKREDKIRVN